MPFLILFVLIPIAEVYTFINVGEEIGILKTLALCVLTALIGGYVVRQQGLGTLLKAQNNLRTGSLPLKELFDGFCIVIAGALLLTPGFVTDTLGFILLVPFLRSIIQNLLSKYGNFNVHKQQQPSQTNKKNSRKTALLKAIMSVLMKKQPKIMKNWKNKAKLFNLHF